MWLTSQGGRVTSSDQAILGAPSMSSSENLVFAALRRRAISPRYGLTIVLLLCVGAAGSLIASMLGLPMPFLIGSLMSVGLFTMAVETRFDTVLTFPEPMRRSFVAMIGVLIGLGFSPELLSVLNHVWLSLAAILLLVPTAFAAGYVVYRHIGKYDQVTALFCAMPGGLIEAVAIGEQVGGKVPILTVQHFARITLVVVLVPWLFWFWSGEAVGSAAGLSFARAGYDVWDVLQTVVIALLGMILGKRFKLPAAILTGPLLLSAILHGSGLLHTDSPGWLLSLSQMVVGTGLGASFAGLSRRQLAKSFVLGAIANVLTLAIALAFAYLVSLAAPTAIEVLFISYTPGGVTEMSLIALSLGISPILVATHHLFRITVAVMFMGAVARWLKRPK